VIFMRGIPLFVLLAAATTILPAPAEARDRPGTPNQEQLSVCGTPGPTYRPILCGRFNNSASEKIRVEIQATRNGASYPLDAAAINCANLGTTTRNPNGTYSPATDKGCYTPAQILDRKDFYYVFATGPLDFGAQYCIRFRARRTSDQVVSEQWSNYACTQTPAVPPKPGKPDFGVTFTGTQTSVAPGTSGQKTATIPERVEVVVNVPSAGAITQEVRIFPLGSTANPLATATTNPFQFPLASNLTAISVQVCGYNFSGQTCTIKPYALTSSSQITLPNARAPVTIPTAKPIHVTGAPANGTPMPRVSSETYMVGIDMPGNDYSSKPFGGTAVDCENMCKIDGKCLSWTWVKPGVQNAQAMCWLKNAVPPSRQNPNTISGIKAGSTALH
jgi:hypothetical protein